MKYAKMLGLLAVAAAAFMAFAGSASATELTGPSGKLGVGATITAVPENGHVKLTGPLGIAVECNSHVAGSITDAGGEGKRVKGSISSLTFPNCTNGYVVDVQLKGTLEVDTQTAGTKNNNGTVFSSGATVLVTNVPILGECGYTTNGTDIGVLTGSASNTATFDISAAIPRTKGNAFCGSTGTWEGNYTVTSPDRLIVH